jgi:hypothetical protein
MAKRFRRDPTTLELARAIADAVLRKRFEPRRRDSARDAATNAVIETLHKYGSWFHRSDFDADGVAIFGTERTLK